MSKRRIEIIPECYVDTTLISILLGSDVNHKKGCPSVSMEMQRGRSAESFAVDDPQLKALFCDLSKTGEVARLKSILKYLDEKRYQSSDEELEKMF